MIKNLKDWKTTVLGVVNIIVFALGSFGVITAGEGSSIQAAITEIINAIGGPIVGTIGISLTALGGVVLLFVKDPKKEEDVTDETTA